MINKCTQYSEELQGLGVFCTKCGAKVDNILQLNAKDLTNLQQNKNFITKIMKDGRCFKTNYTICRSGEVKIQGGNKNVERKN